MNVAVSVTTDQLNEMRHALGLPREKKPYRNRFYVGANNANWNDLVSKGLAKKSAGWEEDMAYFRLTMKGVELACGKKITQKAYDDL